MAQLKPSFGLIKKYQQELTKIFYLGKNGHKGTSIIGRQCFKLGLIQCRLCTVIKILDKQDIYQTKDI